MAMPIMVEWVLVTNGKEMRLANEVNMFEIQLDYYRLFPINQVIEIKRHQDSQQIGNGKIVELAWKNNCTHCKFQLISLFNVN
ncbi:DUF2584 family protein [Radiobacillus sp. PE A8.2]|uniref:DUF2584 family protein n=1 Tax=Radiobacillus sp. PE A8.2 TaxID=3380349 RepID=UPI00388ECB48